MKIRTFLLMLLVPMLFVCCEKSGENGNENGNNQEQLDPDTGQPLVKDGAVLLVTNAQMEKFITDVTDYQAKSWNVTHILDEPYQPTAPGNGQDVPPKFTIRWEPDPAAGDVVVRLWEDDGWSRTYDVDVVENSYVSISNLRPNANYHYEAKAGTKVLTSGSFTTTGHIHQVMFSSIRNARDLGGWKTKDGKTVKYRMIYRGGRMEGAEIRAKGKRDLKAEGIKAQIDLRGHTSQGVQEYLDKDKSPLNGLVENYEFLAPCIEEGYTWMLTDYSEQTKQVMEFIMKCVRENKPVYFHCSLGRDRTGTTALLVLGLLGVDEADISKEYELTQFAPTGYSVCTGESTKMTRLSGSPDYWRAADFIWKKAGTGSFADGVESYLLSLGIAKTDIEEFRSLMLE